MMISFFLLIKILLGQILLMVEGLFPEVKFNDQRKISVKVIASTLQLLIVNKYKEEDIPVNYSNQEHLALQDQINYVEADLYRDQQDIDPQKKFNAQTMVIPGYYNALKQLKVLIDEENIHWRNSMQKKIKRFSTNVQRIALKTYQSSEDRKGDWDKVKQIIQDADDLSDISDDQITSDDGQISDSNPDPNASDDSIND